MRLSEAYSILGIPDGSTEEDAKTAFRKLSFEYHPDRNKSENAEAKFKEINEAFQTIKNKDNIKSTFNDNSYGGGFNYDYIYDVIFQQYGFDPFGYTATKNRIEHVYATTSISFEESVLGCTKSISINRKSKCDCERGKIYTDMCIDCSGTGFKNNFKNNKTSSDKNAYYFTSTICLCCGGKGFKGLSCEKCNGTGNGSDVQVDLKVTISPGTLDGARVILRNQGNFDSKSSRYGDVVVNVSVAPDNDMKLQGVDVISNLEISLLEALKGTTKEVKTIRGMTKLKVPEKIKNGQAVRVAGAGVPGIGSHIFNISVVYPDNIDKLINVLENGE